jgi:hypothetical protein
MEDSELARGEPDRARHLAILRTALRNALGPLPPSDRLRLACYHAQGMTLAAIGRLLDEHAVEHWPFDLAAELQETTSPTF